MPCQPREFYRCSCLISRLISQEDVCQTLYRRRLQRRSILSLVKAARNEPSIQDATVVRATNLAQIKEALVPAVPTEVLSILSENIFVLQQIKSML